MMLKFLCCFVALIQTGWSANQYLFENNRGSTVHTQQHVQQPITAPKIYEKEYFFFSAPDDRNEQSEALKKLTTSVKKRQQVIFIKNPENSGYEKAVQNLIQNNAQLKTHIYVLNKEPNYAGLQRKYQTLQNNIQHKPEVHFIKYRNPSAVQHIHSSIVQRYGGGGGGSGNKVIHTRSVTSDNTPVSKNYARNFLPTGVDVVPGSSYIPLVLY